MNSILQLKGQFYHRKNHSSPQSRNLPNGKSVTVKHIEELEQQLILIENYWQKDTTINGALISVYYNKIVAKSNRLQGLLGNGNGDPNKTIRGSRFFGNNPTQHIFTHYVQLSDIALSIQKLKATREFISSKFGQMITSEQLQKINEKKIKYTNSDLCRTNFAKIVCDCFYVEKFTIDRNVELSTEATIITIYETDIRTPELFSKLGIDMIDAKMIDNTTVRLSSNELQILNQKAPYLIAMQTHDLSQITPEDIQKCEPAIISIPSPKQEPVIGVIDTPFCKNVYFSEWVTYENKIGEHIILEDIDYLHGTEVSSIIVDGPSLNPDLEDGCGRFRVKHFGVAIAKKFSSFSILKSIREIIAENPNIKVWNLSLGSAMEINCNFISPEGAELDKIQNEYDVVFIVAGTNKPNSRKEDMLIGAPADSLNSIVVNSVDENNKPASYHRNGPVLSFFHKPDISYYGGDKGKGICVCTPNNQKGYVSGTSFAAPWITRKVAYLIYNMGLSREIAKALIIDSAIGWEKNISNSIGYGIVPKHINNILQTPDDEIRFTLTGSSQAYETYNYNIPVPIVDSRQPFFARATLCYFPKCQRTQGVDYTNTEMDIHFGRIKELSNNSTKIYPINDNKQDDNGVISITETSARKIYRKWDNIKSISENIQKRSIPKRIYGAGMWGLSIKTKERLKGSNSRGLQFGIVITLKEMHGNNRISEFIKLCSLRGWVVNSLDVQNQIEVFNKGQEEVSFE